MITKEEVYRIGRIGKTHGVKGEVSFHFDDDVFDRVDAEYLIVEVEGLLVPFFMEEYRFRSDTTAIVKFCDIDTQERARELTGSDVFFPRDLTDDDADELSLAFLTGFTLVDNHSGETLGTIASVDDSTLNTLFCLDNGLLVPASADLVTDIDRERQTIYIDLPEGLLSALRGN